MQRTVFKSRWLPYVLVAPQMVVTALFFFPVPASLLPTSLRRFSPGPVSPSSIDFRFRSRCSSRIFAALSTRATDFGIPSVLMLPEGARSLPL